MRAAGIKALGEPVEIFEVDELAAPAAGKVLIDVVAAGIGPWDDLVRVGGWQVGGPAVMALGTEAAGTVAAVGPGVAELREGDEVMTHPLPLRRHGTWAGRLLAPAASIAAAARQRRHGKPRERFQFRRSLRLRHSTRRSGSSVAAGSLSTEPVELRVACSFSSPRRGAPV